MKRALLAAALLVPSLASLAPAHAVTRSPAMSPSFLPGLGAVARVSLEGNGIVHVDAENEHDLFYLAGWVHAQDRLFQMDTSRRLASGTLAELLGATALPSDVALRTIGLRRAAERSLAALLPRTRAALDAYAEGVNAWLALNDLPPEYRALELTRVEPWTPLDSVVVAKLLAFELSFDLDIAPTLALGAYERAGADAGFDGRALYFEDLERSAPFDRASTVPDAAARVAPASTTPLTTVEGKALRAGTLALARAYLDAVKDLPVFAGVLDRGRRGGSNAWAVAGDHTRSGMPLLAGDPHRRLGAPSTYYPLGLRGGTVEVFGSTVPGVPFVVQGYNRHVAWGTTANALDVTDTFEERIVPWSNGFATLHDRTIEPLVVVPQSYRVNRTGNGVVNDLADVPPGRDVPAFTLVSPRRDMGPILRFDKAPGDALSVQWAGFSPTRELDGYLLFDVAQNLLEFQDALRSFDAGSLNVVFSDDVGQIAYWTTGEVPLREDLQSNIVAGLPPWFIRSGEGGNEWIERPSPPESQALPHEVLPARELPFLVNPASGWFVNANNDPFGITLDNDPLNQQRPGGGIYYLARRWDAGFRAGRITERLNTLLGTGTGRVSAEDMQSIQADVVLRDAQFFTPHIVAALANGTRRNAPAALVQLATDPAVAEAVNRLSTWPFDTPTGIAPGYDASDVNGTNAPPSGAEHDSAVAATIYAAWRSAFVRGTIDATLARFGSLPVPDGEASLTALRHLLEQPANRVGIGASGLDFFARDGVAAAADRRDIALLGAVKAAVDGLAGGAFAPALRSPSMADWEWGWLHRIAFAHPLGQPYSVPPAMGLWPVPLARLTGIPTDGGFETVDAASHDVRAFSANAFMFDAGPAQRFVGEFTPQGPRTLCSWPGGTSGVLGSQFYTSLLRTWITNDAVPGALTRNDVARRARWVIRMVPWTGAFRGALPGEPGEPVRHRHDWPH